METLSINSAEPQLSPIQALPAEEQKRPGMAFVLSLLFPGLGHVYCRKAQAGIITAIIFTVCASVVVFMNPTEQPMFWGIALRAAIVLYGFAFLDAFYSTRELNAGLESFVVGSNPRVAAMLNLLTAGFGYFYVGERKKGLAWFLVSRVFFGLGASKSNLIALLVELVCAIVAVDAFRIARKQIRASLPPNLFDQFAISGNGLTPVAPLTLGVILIVNYFVVCCAGMLIPHYAPLSKGDLTIAQKEGGATELQHRIYNVGMTLPSGWEANESSKEFVISARHPDYGCQVGLMMHGNLPVHSHQSIARAMESDFKKSNPTYEWLSEGSASLGGKSAYGLTFQASYNDIPVIEKIIFIQRRLTLYTVIEASSLGAAADCGPMMDSIVSSVKLDF